MTTADEAARAVEDAALTVNALALHLAELDPAQVDREAAAVAQLIHDIGQIRAFVMKVRDQ
jgi:HD superfamily phosphodiesterase